jgi:hypothetical protein
MKAHDLSASPAFQVLNNLKAFYFSFPPDEEDQIRELAKHFYRLHTTGAVVELLCAPTFVNTLASPNIVSSPTSPTFEEEEDLPFVVRKKHQRKKSKASKHVPDNPAFQAADLAQPRTLNEVTETEYRLLTEWKNILQVIRDINRRR